jgi:hypothetical protein
MPNQKQKLDLLKKCRKNEIQLKEIQKLCPNLDLHDSHIPLFCAELEDYEKSLFKEPYYLSFQEYDKLYRQPITLKKKSLGSNIPLANLMPRESFGQCGKKSCLTVYHGSDLKSFDDLITNLSADFGSGKLGTGFYFTPVFEYAIYYAQFRTRKSNTDSIIIEFNIINYEDLKVNLINSKTKDEKSKIICDEPIVSQTGYVYAGVKRRENHYGRIWQFNCKDTTTLQKHFKIKNVYILPT